MRHHSNKRKFGRSKNQNRALMTSLMASLILREKIKTTEAKAKELRPFMERLVTRGKTDTVANRRYVTARLSGRTKETKKLFEKISPKYVDRTGGYTRILKLGARKSDGAKMAYIEFV